MRLAQIAERIGGTLVGDGDVEVTGVAGIREAGASDLTFLANPRYASYLATTQAAAVVVGPDEKACLRPLIRIENPYLGYVRAIGIIYGNGGPGVPRGVHPSAVVSSEARLGERVCVGPCAVIEAGAVVGEGTVLSAHVHVGRDAHIGRDCILHPQVSVRDRCLLGDRVIVQNGAVLGSDGFGYVWDGEKHLKIPHMGRVVLEDDVEVGANTTIDRGTTGETRIMAGTKVDNLVQIAHNVRIGAKSLLAAQVGVSGSTELGERVTLAGQVGLVGHIHVGDRAFVGAQSGVDKNVPEGEIWFGAPARERGKALREHAALARLPELLKQVREMEARLKRLEGESGK